MFDVAFSEIFVIAVVALLVIGPERLPKVARTLGALTGRLQRYVVQVKDEVNREVRFQELQQLQQEIQEKARKVETSILGQIDEVTTTAQASEKIVEKSAEPIPAILSANESENTAKHKPKKTASKITRKSVSKISKP